MQNLDKPLEMNPLEILHLASAYSYFHTQRFSGLFDDCHAALWKVYESDENPAKLLRLFRHSSFVWRIRGQDETEKDYLARLSKRKIETTDSEKPKTFMIEIGYYMRRLKIVLLNVVTS